MKNIFAQLPGESDKVYIECVQCQELVARYTIARNGYFHQGQEYHSYLRGINRGSAYESAKDLQEGYSKIQEACQAEYEQIKKEQAKEAGELNMGTEAKRNEGGQ